MANLLVSSFGCCLVWAWTLCMGLNHHHVYGERKDGGTWYGRTSPILDRKWGWRRGGKGFFFPQVHLKINLIFLKTGAIWSTMNLEGIHIPSSRGGSRKFCLWGLYVNKILGGPNVKKTYNSFNDKRGFPKFWGPMTPPPSSNHVCYHSHRKLR